MTTLPTIPARNVEDSPLTVNVTLSALARGFATSCPDIDTFVYPSDYRQAFYAWNDTLGSVASQLGHEDSHLLLSLVRRLIVNPTLEVL